MNFMQSLNLYSSNLKFTQTDFANNSLRTAFRSHWVNPLPNFV